MSDLNLDSRYIHTGNSGVTIRIDRDVKRSDRAILKVENGAMGAFSTSMRISGNSLEGITSDQLRDIALCFLEAASKLDNRETSPCSHSPHVADTHPSDMRLSLDRSLPHYISSLLPDKGTTVVRGKDSFKVGQLVDNIPDIVPFYTALLDELSSPEEDSLGRSKSRSKSSRNTSEVAQGRTKRRLIIYHGLRLLRSLHTHDLATVHLKKAREDLSSALLSDPKDREEKAISAGVDLASVCYKKAKKA